MIDPHLFDAVCGAGAPPWSPVTAPIHRWAADTSSRSGGDMTIATDQGSAADPYNAFGGNLPIVPLGSLAKDSWKFPNNELLYADPSPFDVLSAGFYIAAILKLAVIPSGQTAVNIIHSESTAGSGPEQVSLRLLGSSLAAPSGILLRRVAAGTGDVSVAFSQSSVFSVLAVGSNAGAWLYVNGILVGSSATAVVIPTCGRWRGGANFASGAGAQNSQTGEIWIGTEYRPSALPALAEAQAWDAFRINKYGT